MFGGRRKSSVKLTKNQPFSPVFIFFCFLLLSHTFGHHHHSHHRPSHYNLHHIQTPSNLAWWLHHLSLSLSSSLPCETLSPLYHRDSSSSNNHSFQRFPPLPAAVEATTLSSSTPTVSNPSTDRHNSNPCNSSSSNPGGSTLHRCHRVHHFVLLSQTTLTPSNFPLPLPPPLLVILHHCSLREQ